MPDGVPLTGRQRDFLASYPDEVTVWVADGDGEDGSVNVYANGELDPAHRHITVPAEGFLAQPGVQLVDPETELDRIPTALWTPEQLEEHRTEVLMQLPPFTEAAFWHLKEIAEHEGIAADFDAILDHLHEGMQPPDEEEEEEEAADER